MEIKYSEVFLTEDIDALLTPEQMRKLKLKKDTLYMVNGTINSIEEITEEYIAKVFTPTKQVKK